MFQQLKASRIWRSYLRENQFPTIHTTGRVTHPTHRIKLFSCFGQTHLYMPPSLLCHHPCTAKSSGVLGLSPSHERVPQTQLHPEEWNALPTRNQKEPIPC